MAKKFVKVTGINKALDYNSTSKKWTLKSSVSSKADSESILYITATADDAANSSAYMAGSHWIYAKGELFGSNPDIDSYLSENSSLAGDIAKGDSVQTAIRKLLKKVIDAGKSGVQSLTTSDDSWIIIDPDLNAATGAVTLNVSHGLPGTSSSTATPSRTNATWGLDVSLVIPKISIDARGHVSELTTTTLGITLPSSPVTKITSATSDNEVFITANTEATGTVTLNTSHALHTAIKKGETADKTLSTSAKSFKVLEVSTNGTGHVTSINERTVTLPNQAFQDTSYGFTGGTQKFYYWEKGANSSTEVSVAHMAKGTTTTTATNGTYISGIAVDSYGHVTDVSTLTNGVYATDAKANHADGELVVWSGATNGVKTTDKTIRTTAIAVDNTSTSTLPTTSQVIDYVQANKVAGAMTYKGTIASKAALDALTGMKDGDTYVLSADDVTAGYQKGDMFIYNGTSTAGTDGWDRIPAGDTKVTNFGATLLTTDTSVATIDGTTVKLKADTATTSKAGYVQLSSLTNSTSETLAATPKAVYDVSNYIHDNKNFSYSATTTSTDTGAYKIGDISINGTKTTIYGKDTVREVKVNGTTKISNTSNGALDISAGKNVSVGFVDNKVVIEGLVENTDEKVKTSVTTSKMFVIGKLDASKGATSHANYDANVYAENGAFHATSLYEGSWSVHDSSVGDWATIE